PRANPSFDCRTARTAVERTICSDVALSELDAEMGRVLQQALRASRDRQSLLENQRYWLYQRDTTCSARESGAIGPCLIGTTKSRIDELTRVATAYSFDATAPPVP